MTGFALITGDVGSARLRLQPPAETFHAGLQGQAGERGRQTQAHTCVRRGYPPGFGTTAQSQACGKACVQHARS